MFSTNKLLGEGVKSGLSYALSKDNAGGYRAVQDAATRAAQLYQPYLQAGADAQKRIADLQGLNGPEAQAAARSQFTADPGYQFALGEGVNAIDASAARRGMLQSGNNERAVQEYGSGLASQMYQQYLKNLYGQAGMGMKAAGGVGQNSIDSATAYAMMKAARANRYNQMVGGIAGALLPSPQDQYYASLYQ